MGVQLEGNPAGFPPETNIVREKCTTYVVASHPYNERRRGRDTDKVTRDLRDKKLLSQIECLSFIFVDTFGVLHDSSQNYVGLLKYAFQRADSAG